MQVKAEEKTLLKHCAKRMIVKQNPGEYLSFEQLAYLRRATTRSVSAASIFLI